MDIDFHYYGTFVAAYLAGFIDEAELIAICAQYVDVHEPRDSIPFKIKPPGFTSSLDLEFYPLPTVDPVSSIATTLYADRHRSIWMPFHFLPGNFNLEEDDTGFKHQLRRLPKGVKEPELFSHLTRPLSPTAVAMVKHGRLIFEQEYTNPVRMHYLGIMMHVFADTYAHQDFAGTPSRELNDAKPAVHISERGDHWEKLPPYQWYSGQHTSPPLIISGVVEGAYVGHGRMGHFPDYSWLKFSYEPGWNKKNQNPKLIRDNRSVYLHALMQMIHALRCVRTGEDYTPLELTDMFTWEDLPKSLKECVSERNFEILREVIAKPPSVNGSHWNYEGAINEKCEHWVQAIMKMGFLRLPAKFEQNKTAFEKMGRPEDPLGSHVIRFSIAAKLQYQFLDAFLQQHKKPFLRDFAYGQVAYTEDLVLMNPKKVSSISIVDTAVHLGFSQLLAYQDLSVDTLRSALKLRKQLLSARSKEQQLMIIEKGLEEARYLEASAVSELPMKSDFNVLARVDEKYFDRDAFDLDSFPSFLDKYKPRRESKFLKSHVRQLPKTNHWGTGVLTTVLKGIGLLVTKRRL
ncbi:hypothetical protein JYJ95_38410 [Corallococcus exiguus]|uniref:DUF6765 family protein n=1 Tax=Corallococcus exiguus TaxID=83462 RepID=UPI001A8D3FE6|nr:DUF6765 family protein [Corallococcus exiguus]MBN8472412.1 hypothetical protein [Corallococcus exiguus]